MDSSNVQANLDIIWVLIAAGMVMFMQAGFTALESGLTRAKNSINVGMKNITDFVASILIFWIVGYGFMFGESTSGLIGTFQFGLGGLDKPSDYAFFVFQVTFAGTAATIVSGAVAERMRFSAYVFAVVMIVGVVYPVSGHWIWSEHGWLSEKGFVDFAGSTVVHSLGGWIGLAGAVILGPRLGRFDESGKPTKIHGHNLVLAMVGVMILWFGWFGFNGGSTLKGDQSVALILLNTLLCAAAGGASCFLTSLIVHSGSVSIEKMLNGIVGGLVAVTAGCAVLTPSGAILLGVIAGVIVFVSEEILLHILKVDDPVNVVSAHGVAGVWGTIGLALIAPEANLPLKSTSAQLLVQCQGVLAVMVWGLIMGAIIFFLLKLFTFLRVSQDAESTGLNVHEHGASSGLVDTMNAMHKIVQAYRKENVDGKEAGGDLTERVHVEHGDEGYEIANLFNLLQEYFHGTVYDIKKGMANLIHAAEVLSKSSAEMQAESDRQHLSTNSIVQSIRELSISLHSVANNTSEASVSVSETNQFTLQSSAAAAETITSMEVLSDNVTTIFEAIVKLQASMGNIEAIVKKIGDISQQTNLLALNAAIEAARAGESGRGFAVVADEVRALSQNTSSATEEIKTLINEFKTSTSTAQAVVEQGRTNANACVSRVNESKSLIGNIDSKVKDIADVSSSIAGTTKQQTDLITEIENHISRVMDVAHSSKTRAAVVSATSDELHELAHKLSTRVKDLKVAGDGEFNLH